MSVDRLPATPAGQRLAAWIDALNTGSAAIVAEVIAGSFAGSTLAQCSAEERAARQVNILFALSSGLTPVSVETSTAHEIVVIAEARLTEDRFRVKMEVEPHPPHGVVDHVVVIVGPPPLPEHPSGAGEEEILAQLDAYIERLASADLFSGSVMVARHGQPLLRRAHGLASAAWGVPNRIDTRFNLGSMNKMFTAVAVVQLAQQGGLAFDDVVRSHLPDYPNEDVAKAVTIHHLLTHTSGLGTFFNDKFQAAKTRLRTVAEFLELFAEEAPAFEPGAKFHYSNSGFVVLGAVVERVSGQSYYDYVRDHVYRPAGMSDTDAYEMDYDVPNLAIGYTRPEYPPGLTLPPRRNNLFRHSIKGSPAGGGYSTVDDLLRFDVALRDNGLLDTAHTDLLLAEKVDMGDGTRYAYGFFAKSIDDRRVAGHGGAYAGTNGQLDLYLDDGWTVAVLANYDPPAAHRIARKMRALAR